MAYGQPGMMPGGLSADSYLDRHLRALDAEHYSAAGLLPYRKRSDGSLELLFALERPWNSFTQAYDPLGWNLFGGKRIPRQEKAPETTAVRCFTESVGQAPGAPAVDVLYRLLANSFALWYALGKFALLVVEVTEADIDGSFPDKFLEWKKTQPSEEFQMTSNGIKKWTKQIDAVEWVPATKLLATQSSEMSDLLANIVQINGFQEFLQGNIDPAVAWPESEQGSKSKGKSKGKDGNAKGKGGKGLKGDKGKGKGWKGGAPQGKGMPAYGGMTAFPAAPMPMMQPAFDQNSMEMQRQMFGEQLYLMVQTFSPSPFLAQKITGMLLELPQNELMMNLTNQEELRRRVEEALEVLREDGIVG